MKPTSAGCDSGRRRRRPCMSLKRTAVHCSTRRQTYYKEGGKIQGRRRISSSVVITAGSSCCNVGLLHSNFEYHETRAHEARSAVRCIVLYDFAFLLIEGYLIVRLGL